MENEFGEYDEIEVPPVKLFVRRPKSAKMAALCVLSTLFIKGESPLAKRCPWFAVRHLAACIDTLSEDAEFKYQVHH